MGDKEETLSSKEHLKKIGVRMRSIRVEYDLSISKFTEKLKLPGAVITRFENGYGIQILNLLIILSWLDSQGYNIKWFMLYDNDKEFRKKEDSLLLYTDSLPINTFTKKEVIKKLTKLVEDTTKLKNIVEEL